MLKAIFKALKVRPDEQSQVTLLLLKGFFVGSFLATYQVSAETLFLNRMNDMLEEALLLSGFLGVLTTALFSSAQSRISYEKLSVINILIIAVYTILIYLGYHFMPVQYQDIMVFIMFAMIGPITAVLLLGFWGVFGRLFDLRQSKRIIGWIDTGQLIAAILTYFLIPLLTGFIGPTDNLLIASGISLLLAATFLIILTSRFELKHGKEEESSREIRRETRLYRMIGNNYIRILSIFLMFSMMSFIFIQYSFQDTIAKQYPSEAELRNFISFFEAFILIFMFILQTFVNDKLISEYGIKAALVIMPVILLIFAALTIFVGHYFGYAPESEGFLYFFLAVALLRLFSKSLRDALENPTFKLYFMPLDNRYRFNIQTKVEGIINEFARFTGAALIFGMALFPIIQTIHLTYFLAALLIGYLFVISKMYLRYKEQIRVKLEVTQERELLESQESKVVGKLQEFIFNENSNKVIFSFKLLEKINPSLIRNNVNKIMAHDSEEVRTFAQIRMNEIKGLSVSDKYIVRYDSNSEAWKGRYILTERDIEELIEIGDISQRRILKLSRSVNPEDRLYAAELIINSQNPENNSILIELLNDANFNVRVSAIKASQQKNTIEVLNAVINNLSLPSYSNQAADALIVIGEKALPVLDAAFFKSGQTTSVMIKLVQIMGKIGGANARNLLWNKVDYPDKIVASQVLIALGHSGFKAGISQITHIKYAIEGDVEDISWNLAAISEVSRSHFGDEIINALKEENEHDIEHIYMLLGMLYDSQSIQLVKDNIESGTNEGVSFAVELLDVFLSDDLKQRIIPVIDDLSESEKFRKLENFYPRQRYDERQVLKLLVNREFNQTNHWTKACVIYQIGLTKDSEFMFDLIAQLFNPDPLLHEMAAWSINQIDTKAFHENVKRLRPEDTRNLENLIGHNNEHLMKFNKIRFMKKLDMFENIHGLVLSELADMSEDIFLSAGSTILITDTNNYNFYLVYRGEAELTENMSVKTSLNEGHFLSEIATGHGRQRPTFIRAISDVILMKFYKDTFYDYLADHIKLADRVSNEV